MKIFNIFWIVIVSANMNAMDVRDRSLIIQHQFKIGDVGEKKESTRERFKAQVAAIALMPQHPIVVGQQSDFTKNSGSFSLYSTDDGEKKATLSDGLTANVIGPAMGSTGKLLAATDSHRAVVFDVETQRAVQTITNDEVEYRAVYLSPNEKELWLGVPSNFDSNSFNFQRFDLASGKCIGIYHGPYRLLSPDRTIGALVNNSSDGQCDVQLQEIVTSAEVGSYRYVAKKPYGAMEAMLLALSADDKTLAAYSVDFSLDNIYPTVDVADYREGKQTATIDNDVQPFWVQFNDGGRYLVVGSNESEASSDKSAINIYDVARSERVSQLIVPQIPINGVDTKGSRLAASWQGADGNGVIQVWNNFKP